jgi:hypothetical protein
MLAMIRPNDNDALAVMARRDDDYRYAVIVRTVSVVRDGRVSMVVRSPNDDLTVEVGIAEAERNPNASLGLRDASREPKQQSENDENPFHDYLLVSPFHREEACQIGRFCKWLCLNQLGED